MAGPAQGAPHSHHPQPLAVVPWNMPFLQCLAWTGSLRRGLFQTSRCGFFDTVDGRTAERPCFHCEFRHQRRGRRSESPATRRRQIPGARGSARCTGRSGSCEGRGCSPEAPHAVAPRAAYLPRRPGLFTTCRRGAAAPTGELRGFDSRRRPPEQAPARDPARCGAPVDREQARAPPDEGGRQRPTDEAGTAGASGRPKSSLSRRHRPGNPRRSPAPQKGATTAGETPRPPRGAHDRSGAPVQHRHRSGPPISTTRLVVSRDRREAGLRAGAAAIPLLKEGRAGYQRHQPGTWG